MSTPWTPSCAGIFLLDVLRKPQKYMASKDLHLSGYEMKKDDRKKEVCKCSSFLCMAALNYVCKWERTVLFQCKKCYASKCINQLYSHPYY